VDPSPHGPSDPIAELLEIRIGKSVPTDIGRRIVAESIRTARKGSQ
jgi:hypothetical protein